MSSTVRPGGGSGPGRLLPARVPAHVDEVCAVYIGDAAEVLHDLPAAAVDAVVTDPPAGIRFRGMRWDTFRPARPRGGSKEQDPARQAFIDFLNPVMRECLRALKPGGHALAWAIPRTSHWTATAIEDAGFEVRDVITHHFGTGFPKTRLLARPWRGWSTRLKPASEHWILARKPLEGDLRQNLHTYGTGALNIAACRIVNGRLSRCRPTSCCRTSPTAGRSASPAARSPSWTARAAPDQAPPPSSTWPSRVRGSRTWVCRTRRTRLDGGTASGSCSGRSP